MRHIAMIVEMVAAQISQTRRRPFSAPRDAARGRENFHRAEGRALHAAELASTC